MVLSRGAGQGRLPSADTGLMYNDDAPAPPTWSDLSLTDEEVAAWQAHGWTPATARHWLSIVVMDSNGDKSWLFTAEEAAAARDVGLCHHEVTSLIINTALDLDAVMRLTRCGHGYKGVLEIADAVERSERYEDCDGFFDLKLPARRIALAIRAGLTADELSTGEWSDDAMKSMAAPQGTRRPEPAPTGWEDTPRF